MNISIGNDHAGVDLKEAIISYLEQKDINYTIMGLTMKIVLTTRIIYILWH